MYVFSNLGAYDVLATMAGYTKDYPTLFYYIFSDLFIPLNRRTRGHIFTGPFVMPRVSFAPV